MTFPNTPRFALALTLGLLSLLVSQPAHAHCDTMDGPVVSAARQALASGNVNPALAWVQPADASEIRAAFARARQDRQEGGSAAQAADQRFLEVLVKIHRAGEGAPYTGIKPAGTPLDPGVQAADRALETGSAAEVERLLVSAVRAGLQKHFGAASSSKRYDPDDVAAGRAYVNAYVTYAHFVEGIHEAATASGHDHGAAGEHAHATAHDPADGASHPAHGDGGRHADHLPWVVTAFLALLLLAETAWLLSRRRRSQA